MIGGSTAVLGVLSAAVYILYQLYAPEVYMDEIFHVPQTQKYCSGNWLDWDKKITTFPGLYVLGVSFSRVVNLFLKSIKVPTDACGVAVLRALNLCFATGCYPILYQLCILANPGMTTQSKALFQAAACAIFPLHYFYAFLYYTDVPSAFFVLAACLATKQRHGILAGILSAAAVALRQTNAVWIAFIAAEALLEHCHCNRQCSFHGSFFAERKIEKRQCKFVKSSSVGLLWGDLRDLAACAWRLKAMLVHLLGGHILVVFVFAVFVVWNGGVVVGDKAHHKPVKHLMQPLYFSLFTTLFLAPIMWWPSLLCNVLRGARKFTLWQSASLIAAWGISIHLAQNFTLVHPFILADNRHYIFYLWRKALIHSWIRLALTPLYVFSVIQITNRLQHKGWLWLTFFWVSTCLVVVPAHLVELRYFTIPFLMVLANIRARTVQLVLVFLSYAFINLAAIAVYLGKSYVWVDGTIARFMW